MAFWRASKKGSQDRRDLQKDGRNEGTQAREEREKRRKEQTDVPCDPSQIVSIVDQWFYSPYSAYHPDHVRFRERLLKAACQMQHQQPRRELIVRGCKDDGDVVDKVLFGKADILQGLWQYIDQPREDNESYHKLRTFCKLYEKSVIINVKPRGPELAKVEEPEECNGPPLQWQ